MQVPGGGKLGGGECGSSERVSGVRGGRRCLRRFGGCRAFRGCRGCGGLRQVRRLGERAEGDGGGPVHAGRGEQTAAADVRRVGDHPARGTQDEHRLLVHLHPPLVTVTRDRTLRQLRRRTVQPLLQPGAQPGHHLGDHLRPYTRPVVRPRSHAHRTFSPTQRASSSGLNAATGMPAATNRLATAFE